MAGSSSIGEAQENPVGINVTPMVDVIFCLCLFFMCSFHFKQLQGKIETWLPKDRGVFQGPASSGLTKDEIVVVMRWDGTQTTRKVKGYGAAGSDGELIQNIRSIADGFDKSNNTWPLVIDAGPDVPWQDVVNVMDLCKGNNIERIEFGAPQREIE